MLSTRPAYRPAFAPRRGLLVTIGEAPSPSPVSLAEPAARPIETRELGTHVLLPAVGGAIVGYGLFGILGAAILAAVGGGGGYYILRSGKTSSSSGTGSTGDNPHGAVLLGRIVACGKTGTPGLAPLRRHVQSDPLYPWCYVLGPHDTAGNIAAAIVGDEWRYQELVAVNAARMKTIGIPGKLGPDEWNFAAEEMEEGRQIALPATWALWIDPFATPRGRREPWPEDSRLTNAEVSGGVQVEGYEVTNFSPDGEFIHYGAAS